MIFPSYAYGFVQSQSGRNALLILIHSHSVVGRKGIETVGRIVSIENLARIALLKVTCSWLRLNN